ncbi:LppU/SCO3897 family protein [Nocardia asteroides]|uniref:LppU/SCO3897 family protein n=1 Tax=Nocardia asteroides TaxID=1824 RepID=UPI001E524B02|nr:hypothetical protein [Nocardia asteroides]UGT55308.1 hypothetical protein LTT85_00050 [Nocardia asteroides]
MPGSVHAARAVIVVMAAIGLVGTVVLIGLGHPRAAGANAYGYLFFWALAITACFFGRRRRRVRVTATVFAVLEGFVALGSTAFSSGGGQADGSGGVALVRLSPGPFGVVAVIAVLVLLYQRSAGEWFTGTAVTRRRGTAAALIPLGIVVAVALGAGVWAVVRGLGGDAEPAVGDCVSTADEMSISSSDAKLVKVGCSEANAQAKIIARLDDTGESGPCRVYEDGVRLDAYDGIEGVILCLRPFS